MLLRPQRTKTRRFDKRGLGTSGYLNFAWVIPQGLAVTLPAAVFAKFLLRLPGSTMLYFVMSGAIYLAGTLGFEMPGGKYITLPPAQEISYSVIYTVEELREKDRDMKKLKNEKELVKKAIAAGVKYGEERGVVEFEATDSATEKIEYIYRLLVHDKIIQPLPQDQISQLSMKHRLAMWASKLD